MTEPSLLLIALRDASAPPLRLLPEMAADLLEQVHAPPRLAAHLRLVHDVACQIADWADGHCPALGYDRGAVLFGAATHDIGKTIHIAELSAPGSEHEQAGRRLLLAHGISPELARFAATHASWTSPGITADDLMVSVADKVWKNKRVPELEDLLVAKVSLATGRQPWEEFIALDGLLETIGDGAGERLAFQASFPAHPTWLPNRSRPPHMSTRMEPLIWRRSHPAEKVVSLAQVRVAGVAAMPAAVRPGRRGALRIPADCMRSVLSSSPRSRKPAVQAPVRAQDSPHDRSR